MVSLKKNSVPAPILRAECREMCPDAEFNMRVKNDLVNTLEKKIINSRVHYNLVKEYSRPAADKKFRNKDLRTLETLVKTTIYLIDEVYTRDDVSFISIYEFLFDRFRAIRQDLIIQRSDEKATVQILQAILNFYLLSDYKLCGTKTYEEYLNYQQLSEVLGLILASDKCENKGLYYAIYILLHLDNTHSLIQILKATKSLRRDCLPLLQVVELLKFYANKNFVEVFRISRKLPLICQLALHRRVPSIEDSMISVYNVSYAWKNTKFPVSKFIELTLMNGRNSLEKYIESGIIVVDEEENIIFDKKNSQKSHRKGTAVRERLKEVDKALLKIDGERSILRFSFENENTSKANIDDVDFAKKLLL